MLTVAPIPGRQMKWLKRKVVVLTTLALPSTEIQVGFRERHLSPADVKHW